MYVTRIVTGILEENCYIASSFSGDSNKRIDFIVDPGDDADKIITELAAGGYVPSYILLTHGHFDHVGALPALKKKYPAVQIAVHSGDESYLGHGSLERMRRDFKDLDFAFYMKSLTADLPPADIILEEHMCFIPGWTVLHTPGHSAGSVCFYNEKEKILFSGDTLFLHSYGRTDLAGGSAEQLAASLDRLMQLPRDTRVFPGHGQCFMFSENF